MLILSPECKGKPGNLTLANCYNPCNDPDTGEASIVHWPHLYDSENKQKTKEYFTAGSTLMAAIRPASFKRLEDVVLLICVSFVISGFL